jgi:hypothetical protein
MAQRGIFMHRRKAAIATRGIPRILAAARFSPALWEGNARINHAFQTD